MAHRERDGCSHRTFAGQAEGLTARHSRRAHDAGPTTEQPRGNSHIRHSRARVLGGCSSHNTLIA
ncbi:hypothetical protein AB0E81_39130, partial [Streptomyces sp. NPDC033538]|uniref:hypothetical protein n=1 Tax=Streptomyces sp. NPDC033538 TaxID=3155367 RepID=UPI0033DF36AF